LHGFSQTHKSWDYVLHSLSAHRTLIIPDLPGHTKLDLPEGLDCSVEGCITHILAILGKEGMHSVDLVGYSLGGRIALALALSRQYMIRTLCLVSATAGIDDATERGKRTKDDHKLADMILEKGTATFIRYWLSQPLFEGIRLNNPKAFSREIKNREHLNKLGLAQSLRQASQGVVPSVWSRLPELKMPVLIFAGEKDVKYSNIALNMAKLIPNAQAEILSNTWHTPHIERPREFSKRLVEFWRQSSNTA